MTDAERIEVLHVYEAPPTAVYDAWLDGSLGAWMTEGLRERLEHLDLQPSPGGLLRLVTRKKGAQVERLGRFVELDPPNRLVFTWGVVGEGEPVRVQVDLAPHGGGTALTLAHRIDPALTWFVSETEAPWMAVLEALDRHLAPVPA